MIKQIFSFLAFFLLINSVHSQQVNVMTYNIRYDAIWDTINSWQHRKQAVLEIMEESDVGIIGVQEALLHQMQYINDAIPSFQYVGVGRDDGKEKGEFSAIFYDALQFKLIENQTFWLSKTPEKPSVGWDAALERICTVALFEEKKSGKQFWVSNTHFDHMGKKARKKSAQLILKKIAEFNILNLPVILMGDFNTTPDEKPYQILVNSLQDSRLTSVKMNQKNKGTFNGFEKEFEAKRIDYIFTNYLSILSYTQVNDQMSNGNYPSDHFPVLVMLKLN